MQHRISDLRCTCCQWDLYADLVEDEERAKWCHTEGVTKMLWGLDLAFLVMYLCRVFPAFLWLGLFLVLTIVIIIMAYKNNGKYLK